MSNQSNDSDKWHMVPGDPIKIGQKVMEGAEIISTDTQERDSKNVLL